MFSLDPRKKTKTKTIT